MLYFLLWPSNIILKTQEQKESLLYLPVFLFFPFFLLSWCLKSSSFTISFLFRDFFLVFLLGQVYWQHIFLVFLHLRIPWFPFHFFFFLIKALLRYNLHAIQFTQSVQFNVIFCIFIDMWNHHHNQLENIFITSKETPYP